MSIASVRGSSKLHYINNTRNNWSLSGDYEMSVVQRDGEKKSMSDPTSVEILPSQLFMT